MFSPLSSQVNTFLDMPIAWSSPVCVLLERPLVLIESGKWERTTLRSTLVRWVLTTLRFSPVRCVLKALEFLPVHWEAASCCPLVASFLLVFADMELYGECCCRWWVSPFACDDFRSSHRDSWLCCGIGYCGACSSRFFAMWFIMASTVSIATHLVSMFCSTLFIHLACSSTLSMTECRPLWVCSLSREDVRDTWCVLAITLEVKLGVKL